MRYCLSSFNSCYPMFSSSANAQQENVICKGALFLGDLEAVQALIIDGEVYGSIIAPSVTISGRVTGDVFALNTIRLKATAVIEGSVQASQLAVEYGGTINGSCKINP